MSPLLKHSVGRDVGFGHVAQSVQPPLKFGACVCFLCVSQHISFVVPDPFTG